MILAIGFILLGVIMAIGITARKDGISLRLRATLIILAMVLMMAVSVVVVNDIQVPYMRVIDIMGLAAALFAAGMMPKKKAPLYKGASHEEKV